jgi:mannose-6-phosphate isomerase
MRRREAMNEIRLLRNTIQRYPWGSRTTLARLQGRPYPSEQHEAEMWMGTHPAAASMVVGQDGKLESLGMLVASAAKEILGEGAAARFSPRLPFLFKVLAAERPLSLQVHPDQRQAEAGFARETAAGVPLDSPRRSYVDTSHKPELVCALSPFHALHGFRSPAEILERLLPLEIEELTRPLAALAARPDAAGLASFFAGLLRADPERRRALTAQARQAASRRREQAPYAWLVRLGEEHDGDPTILAPLLLNLVSLAPGEALYTPPGTLHCYLEGDAIEVMACSDNVLRAGLTGKHVDSEELLSITCFEPSAIAKVLPQPNGAAERFYRSPAEEFQLSSLHLDAGTVYESALARNVEILICTHGDVAVTTTDERAPQKLSGGESMLVPAGLPRYRLRGVATLFKATVP